MSCAVGQLHSNDDAAITPCYPQHRKCAKKQQYVFFLICSTCKKQRSPSTKLNKIFKIEIPKQMLGMSLKKNPRKSDSLLFNRNQVPATEQ